MAGGSEGNGSAHLILGRLHNRVNIMIVADRVKTLEDYEALLAGSPALRVFTARSMDDVRKLTGSGRRKWHCWLLDLFLGNGEMATELLPRHSGHPYVVAMSAQSSRQDTSEAMRLGALYVMDKTEARMADVAEMVCRVSALGVLLKGEPTHRREVFEPLIYERCVTSVEQWRKHAGISIRSLQKVCTAFCSLSPSQVMTAFHALTWLFNTGCKKSSYQNLPSEAREHCEQCVERTAGDKQVLGIL